MVSENSVPCQLTPRQKCYSREVWQSKAARFKWPGSLVKEAKPEAYPSKALPVTYLFTLGLTLKERTHYSTSVIQSHL